MSQKSTVFVVGLVCLVFSVFASGVEKWFPRLAPAVDPNACYQAGVRSSFVLASLVAICAIAAVALAYGYARRLWPYRFDVNDLSADKDDLWRHSMPFLWSWNVFAVLISLWRLFEFAGCDAAAMPDFARWMMFNNMPGTILLVPILLGGFAIYAIYFAIGFACRGIATIGEIK